MSLFFFIYKKLPEKPDVPWLTHQIWKGCHDLEDSFSCFQGICKDIIQTPIKIVLGRLEVNVNPCGWDGYSESTVNEELTWDERLTPFQKLCMIKCFKEDKVSF